MRDVLHEDRVDSAIAFMSATLGVGGALGLPISALITERSDWHFLFWMAAGLGVVVFALVLWIVPVSVLRTAGRFDFVGAAGLAAGLIGILLAISRGNEWGWGSPVVLACGLGGSRCCSCGAGTSCGSTSRSSTCGSPPAPRCC